MVTASGCHAMWLLLSALLAPGDEVVLFTPYFPPYPQQVRMAGGVPGRSARSAAAGLCAAGRCADGRLWAKNKGCHPQYAQ